MDIVIALGEASATRVREEMADPPSYSAVRALVRVLEEKGHLQHRREGVRNIYRPKRSVKRQARDEMRRTLATFFRGDVENAMTALLDAADRDLTADEVRRLKSLIDDAKKEGR
jgi:predicted transcriptional regulator